MDEFLLRDVRILEPGRGMRRGDVLVAGGRIIGVGDISPPATLPTVRGEGRLLTPGLIDVHTHGFGTFLYDRGQEDLMAAARFLPQFGTTTILPTLYKLMNRPSLNLLAKLAASLSCVSTVCMPGFHLEGPFLALPGAGCETVPGDLVLLQELLDACQGRVRAMSISPDAKGILPVIEALVARGIVPFITHTAATAEQTQSAIDAGAVHATHFYDVFPAPAVTEPGVRPVGAIEAILANKQVSVDFIADGVHVSPFAIRAALAAKGWRGIVLITDSFIGAGLPPGVYEAGVGIRVRVADGDAIRNAETNRLNGSALTMNRGIANLLRWLDLPPPEIWAMGTLNPASLVGLARKGRIEPGADADMVLWDAGLNAVKTWSAGKLVYTR